MSVGKLMALGQVWLYIVSQCVYYSWCCCVQVHDVHVHQSQGRSVLIGPWRLCVCMCCSHLPSKHCRRAFVWHAAWWSKPLVTNMQYFVVDLWPHRNWWRRDCRMLCGVATWSMTSFSYQGEQILRGVTKTRGCSAFRERDHCSQGTGCTSNIQ